ncbi:MAG: right-handed parallel beta-helix repeat-containing protein [Deltaproteobacteria bacterium]|nr:right-handed parallel beta-helix repeat-containing protein [Deltaproteobacteria bacterium]
MPGDDASVAEPTDVTSVASDGATPLFADAAAQVGADTGDSSRVLDALRSSSSDAAALAFPRLAMALLALVVFSLPACSTLHFDIVSAMGLGDGGGTDSEALDGAWSEAADGGYDAGTAVDADAGPADSGDGSACGAPLTSTVLPLYPASGAAWNDYVSISDPSADAFHQPDLPCQGSEANYYACIHGGEVRRVAVPFASGCAGLSAFDSLRAFDWICDASNGVAFLSTGLAQGKGLADLLEAGSFKESFLTVLRGGCPVLQTPPAIWWSNPVRPLPANPSPSDPPLVLAEEGSVYTAPASGQATSGYNLAADRIAVVTLGTGTLTYSGYAPVNCTDPGGTIPPGPDPLAYRTVICSGDHKHLWIEGRVSGTGGAETLLFFARTSFSRVHRSELWGGAGGDLSAGLSIDDGSRANLVSEVRAHHNHEFGISLFRADANIVMDCVVAHNGSGVRVEDGCQGNAFLRLMSIDNTAFGFSLANRVVADPLDANVLAMSTALFNGDEGFSLRGLRFSSLQASLSAHNNGDGLSDTALAVASNALTNAVLLNGQNGLTIASSQNQIKDVVLAHNQGVGVALTGDANQVRGLLGVGNNAAGDCSVAVTSTANLLDASCHHGEGLATPPLLELSLLASFFGPLAANDAVNTTAQSQGSASATLVTDWVAFENPWRAWGPQGAFLTAMARGPCVNGSCHVYDQRLVASDAVLRNAYGVFVPGAPCPSAADASNPENLHQGESLATGIELVGDRLRNSRGNNNGLCESNEGCLFTPNLGAYQGEGSLSAEPCVFTGGSGVTGVRLYGFTDSGAASRSAPR